MIMSSLYSAVLVIAGTTAVGKTDLSLELAKVLNGEVISADSVQVGATICTSLNYYCVHV